MTEWEDLQRYPVTTSDDPVVRTLLKAILDQEILEITYYGGSRPGDTRKIVPQRVYAVEGGEGLYLDAYCHTRQEVRCFRVDRMEISTVSTGRAGKSDAGAADIADAILQIVRTTPGLKAKDIAERLGADRKLVNAQLYGPLRGRVRQNKGYRWYVREARRSDLPEDKGPQSLDTPLARLCRYYLDCLSHDDLGGVSEFAASKFGPPQYVELAALPMFDESDPFDTEPGRQFLSRVRRDRHRQVIFLGYPTRLNLIRSRKGWEGFMVEPIFLFPFKDAESRYGTPTLADDPPIINFRALRSLSNTGEMSLMQEVILLAEDLGLANAVGEQPDLDELVARLRDIRGDWDWQEEPDPYELTTGDSLAAITKPGIYNRAILIAAERSPYTRGLESELGQLQLIEQDMYRDTALGAWLSGQTIPSPPADQQPLLEVLPLNSEERQAVRQALVNPLTVITGPPGTGKSQVVASILINAAWQGKSVLFASKNNKAVDVVETRVNALGPRPVLLRLGANEYQATLAEYLVSLLAAKATADDEQRYEECSAIHQQLQRRAADLDREVRGTVKLRNEVDAREQRVEVVRQNLGGEVFARMRKINVKKLERAASYLQAAIDQANRAKQGLLVRILWPLMRNRRFLRLAAVAERFRKAADYIGLPLPDRPTDSDAVDEWIRYGERLARRVSQAVEAKIYFKGLAALTEAPSIEELSQIGRRLTDELAANSEALWEAWLRLQPSRLTSEQRRLLGDYSALLQMIVSANEQGRRLGRKIFRRYYELFPKITSILSCWAVTSLSARGRIPFDPNFFDLLVVDEASQCDIASALPLLYRARRVVVIGDPMQLRHISTLSKQEDGQLLTKHGLVESYAGWAYSTRSLFDLAGSLCQSGDIVALRDHHRSHADIIEFSNKMFYEGRLRVATKYERLRLPDPDGPTVRWVDVRGRTVRPGTGGALNKEEARRVVAEMERLVKAGYRGTIGVVSPFRAQANLIRELVYQHDHLSTRIIDVDFLADTVHKFQGDERDVMMFSPVVSAGVRDTALGFLRRTPNLFNVAITRARAALIVVGDKTAALNCGVSYLAKFAGYVDALRFTDRRAEEHVRCELGPEYPPVSHPERVSDWERLFYRAMYSAGIRAIPQYPVEKYVLDFAVLAGERRLNIEIDGEHYHRNWDGDLCRRDQIRNQRLMELGWDVMRFWVYQVRDDLRRCISRVQRWIEEG